jgi:lipid-A-disaccharide synthase
VDLPDFNLRLAARLKRAGVPVVYFVSPQVWAWRGGRVKAMAKSLDLLLCILPFEKEWYRQHAPSELKVVYVGHPAVEEIPDLPYAPEKNLVALLPGSRLRELESLLPIMLEAALKISEADPEIKFELPLASILRGNPKAQAILQAKDSPVGSLLAQLGEKIKIVEVPAHQVLRRARLALVASGTATLETALVGTPMVVIYRVSRISAFIFKNFVGYSGPVAMANILHVGLGSDRRILPELLQDNANATNLAGEALRILADQKIWTDQATTLATTRKILSAELGSPTEKVIRELENFLVVEPAL